MASQRDTRTTQVKGRTLTFLVPTDGQMAVLAQNVRLGKKKTTELGAQFGAIGTIMTVLDNLVVDDDDRDFLSDLLVTGELDIPQLITAVLGGEETVDGEVVNAAPKTVIKRTGTKRA